MTLSAAPIRTLPFELGSPRSFRGLTVLPLIPVRRPALDYLGLDEAVASGLVVSELDDGAVEALVVENPLADRVLLYEGEELLGAKQNRIVQRSVLVPARSSLKIPVNCVEQGRWSSGGGRFAPA